MVLVGVQGAFGEMWVLLVGGGVGRDWKAGAEIGLGIPVHVPRAGERIFRLAARGEEVGWADS